MKLQVGFWCYYINKELFGCVCHADEPLMLVVAIELNQSHNASFSLFLNWKTFDWVCVCVCDCAVLCCQFLH